MAQNLTQYGQKVVLDHFFGRIDHPFPANVYLALFSADPGETGSLAGELTQSGYARVEISDLMGDTVLASGIISNTGRIRFGPAGVDWPEIVAVGTIETGTIGAGNLISYGPPVTSRVVEEGDYFDIEIGQITFRLY
jgi:hypothetical protein